MAWYNASWNYRVKVTVQSSQVASDLTNYPVYVNLANLPAGFHTNVNQTDARDIRVTKTDGTTELAREVVFYDSTNDKGELHFKADSISSSSNTDFYIYYGNSGASDYAEDATYGSQNVWTGHQAVYHFQEGTLSNVNDETANNNNGTLAQTDNWNTDIGSMGGGYAFDGDDDYLDTGITSLGEDLTIIIVGKTADTTSNIYFYGTQNTTNQDFFFFRNNHGGTADTIRVSNIPSGLTGAQGNATSVNINDNNFNVFGTALTRSTNPDEIRYHLNGSISEVTYDQQDNTTGTATTTHNLLLFARNANGTPDGHLQIDATEVRIVQSVLSSDELSAIYTNINTPATFYNVASQESQGISPSASASPSASVSPSASPSVSPSVSPSPGYSLYTREANASLPTDDTDLTTTYSSAEETNISASNDTRVGITGAGVYLLHQFKNQTNKNAHVFKWEGQSTLAPSTSAVILQIYNQNSGSWETLATNNTANADSDFILSKKLSPLSDYKTAQNVISCRVYQLGV